IGASDMTRPTPPHLRLLTGVHRERARGTPRVPASCPEPPTWLSPVALEEWHRLGPQLAAAGVLTQLDAVAFGLLCQSFADAIEADDQIRRFGKIVRDKGTPRLSPLVRIRDAARQQYVALAREFGVTPA